MPVLHRRRQQGPPGPSWPGGHATALASVPSVPTLFAGFRVMVGSAFVLAVVLAWALVFRRQVLQGSERRPLRLLMTYDPLRDLAPIGLAATGSFLLVASSASKLKSVDDLVKAARARPGALDYASPGIATPHHMLGDIVLNSSFPEAELERERQVLLQEYIEDEEDPLSTAFKLFDRLSFGSHPAGLPVIGLKGNIGRFSRDDLLG